MNELLGPAEQHIIKEFEKVLEDIKKYTQELSDHIDEIDTDKLEQLMLDTKDKTLIIDTIPHLQALAKNLSHASLLPLILSAVMKNK